VCRFANDDVMIQNQADLLNTVEPTTGAFTPLRRGRNCKEPARLVGEVLSRTRAACRRSSAWLQ
jgi:hypothetical protein